MYKQLIKSELKKIIRDLALESVNFNVERPNEEKFGDYATNLAMVLAKNLKKPPLEIAKEISIKLKKVSFLERIELEPPGFINFYLKRENLLANLKEILDKKEKFGAGQWEKKTKIVLEHTAVNPNKPTYRPFKERLPG